MLFRSESWDCPFRVEDFYEESIINRNQEKLAHRNKLFVFDIYAQKYKYEEKDYIITQERASLLWHNKAWHDKTQELKTIAIEQWKNNKTSTNSHFNFLAVTSGITIACTAAFLYYKYHSW